MTSLDKMHEGYTLRRNASSQTCTTHDVQRRRSLRCRRYHARQFGHALPLIAALPGVFLPSPYQLAVLVLSQFPLVFNSTPKPCDIKGFAGSWFVDAKPRNQPPCQIGFAGDSPAGGRLPLPWLLMLVIIPTRTVKSLQPLPMRLNGFLHPTVRKRAYALRSRNMSRQK
jgi:hypothetical protein